MATYTAQDVIKAAFRKLGILAKSEAPTSDEMQDALQALNIMIDNWSARRLMGTALIQENFPLTANTQSYTIGTGQTFNTTKPVTITSAYYTDSQNNIYPLNVVTRELFDSYQDNKIVSAPPDALLYDPGATQQANQAGTIYLYFTPDSSSSYTLYINSQKTFTEFPSLTANVTFPASYLKALVYGLSIEIAPEYGKQVSPEIHELFQEAIEDLEAVNAGQLVAGLDLPSGKGRSYNWISDEAH